MIREKLAILLSSEIIDQETQDYVLSVLEYLLKENIIEEEQQADVFLTHLAMADMRRVRLLLSSHHQYAEGGIGCF